MTPEERANRDFNPSWGAKEWLANLAKHLNMKQEEGEPLWKFKNRMYEVIRKRRKQKS